MTSLLRQIVAGPRAKHQETGLDLCYVTSNIIATSGPSQTYPQRAYRNPLDQLVAFLNKKHGANWAIWEFRAEGTGYPDEAVYHRIRHYPWPDHHPPPFRLVPMIMASMRNWLNGGALDGTYEGRKDASREEGVTGKDEKKSDRVVVVHCKAGKGRSGTMACSYLVSQCEWTPEDALARFTERRMRPKFGAGVSIPSQLRWVSYVDRWTRGGKTYVDREIEVLEVHIWGLRHGVKVSIEGFVDDGKKIRVFHKFTKDERYVIEGDAPGGAGFMDLFTDMAGYAITPAKEDEEGEVLEDANYEDIVKAGPNPSSSSDILSKVANSKPAKSASKKIKAARTKGILRKLSQSPSTNSVNKISSKSSKGVMIGSSTSLSGSATSLPATSATAANISNSNNPSQSRPSLLPNPAFVDMSELGGQAVIFKPETPVRLPTSDVNLSLERRNRAPGSMGLTMVTAVAHVWFNAFFEGSGPEHGGQADDSGVFEIDWDRMDGIKGSSQKGTRAADRVAILWRAVGTDGGEGGTESEVGGRQDAGGTAGAGVTITEPRVGSPVPQMEAADWKGGNEADPEGEKRLGLRTEDPDSAAVSKASSIKSQEIHSEDGKDGADDKDDESLEGVKTSGPEGEEVLGDVNGSSSKPTAGDSQRNESGGAGAGSTAESTAQMGFIVE